MSYTHLTINERKCLHEYLAEGLSIRKIADLLERSPSTISREIRRNRSNYRPHHKPNNPYWYNHHRAQTLYIMRRRQHKRQALQPGTPEWEYIIEKLKKAWPPEAIANRWLLDHPEGRKLCISTIYRYIKKGRFENITAKKHLRRRAKRILPKSSSYNSIQPDRIIPQWPEEIVSRARQGDWEGDTVYGAVGKGLLVTLVDRNTRYLRMGLLNKRAAEETAGVVCDLLKDLPVHSISLDNGSEFSEFRRIEKRLNTLIYFAEPHKPWQRGTNENTNGIIRFFFPKGTKFHEVSPEAVKYVEDLINNRPRKCLNWRTPAEVFSQ